MITKKTYTFTGFSYKQNAHAPELFSFVAPSEVLTNFCGVARKDEGNLTNYQRALDKRRVTEEVKEFFKRTANCSPTALVLCLCDNPLAKFKIEEIDSVEITDDTSGSLKKLIIEVADLDSLTKDEVVDSMKDFLDNRISTEEEEGEEGEEEPGDEEGEVEDEEGEVEDEETGDDETEPDAKLEIGSSILKKLRKKLDTELPPEMVEELRDMLKPALVIDGQHRLFGAAEVEENIPFLVCVLVNPDWKEQVFQFAVINSKAVGIPKPFITSLAGMSLTGSELNSITERLQQAGVQLWEVEVMQRIGFDTNSPFCEMIDFKLSKGPSSDTGLAYQTMKKIGKAWYDPGKNATLDTLMTWLYQPKKGKKLTKKDKKLKWQEPDKRDWFELFVIFWEAVKVKFEPKGMWVPHASQLMITVALLKFQDVFFKKAAAMMEMVNDNEIHNDDDLESNVKQQFRKVVDLYVSKFEEKHFKKPWMKSLDHKEGKEALEEYFSHIFDNSNTVGLRLLKKSNNET